MKRGVKELVNGNEVRAAFILVMVYGGLFMAEENIYHG